MSAGSRDARMRACRLAAIASMQLRGDATGGMQLGVGVAGGSSLKRRPAFIATSFHPNIRGQQRPHLRVCTATIGTLSSEGVALLQPPQRPIREGKDSCT